MRITTIVTSGQRAAVEAALTAARLVVARIEEAKLLELAVPDREDGIAAYKPLNVWGAGEDSGELYCTREMLWCDVEGETNHHRLTGADVAELTGLLRTAAEQDPNVFNPGELASGAWELDLDAVLALGAADAADRLVALIAELKVDEIDLDDLVHDTASRRASDDFNNGEAHDAVHGDQEEIASEVNNGGVRDQARFLIDRLGEAEAFAAVKIHHAS